MVATFRKTSADEAEQLLDRAISHIPDLCVYGSGLGDDYGKVFREGGHLAVALQVAAKQQDLKNSLASIAISADWVKHLTPVRGINKRRSSYTYKHLVEAWSRSNGSFIASAVGLGFNFIFPGRHGSNAYFNFGEASLKRFMRGYQIR